MAAGLALTVLAPIRHIWLCFVIGQGICLFISFAIMHKDMTRLRKETLLLDAVCQNKMRNEKR